MKNIKFFVRLIKYSFLVLSLISTKNNAALSDVSGRDPSVERVVIKQKRAQLHEITQKLKTFKFAIRETFMQLKSDREDLVKKITQANSDAKLLAEAQKSIADSQKGIKKTTAETTQAMAIIAALEKRVPAVFNQLETDRTTLLKKISQARNYAKTTVDNAKKEITTIGTDLLKPNGDIDRFKDKGQQLSTDAQEADELKATIVPNDVKAANRAVAEILALNPPEDGLPDLAKNLLPKK
jgi:chromosome segregation ATPase